jgi:hypothetical protein
VHDASPEVLYVIVWCPGRIGFRMPDEPDELPAADAVVVAPATFNTP